ncbi:hypothetical protein CHARACLAT_013027 [Characodon lateralis]|uniref:Uncharacterized protein n=1 Tax=Characodon lateralis TaxID=208331 RepID=A0ABU7D6D8_9TELE|nr:hypothetical protein [Characodon lateralis]
MVNTSVNLPQSKGHSGSTRSNCKITPHFTCPACPPSNTINHVEEIARSHSKLDCPPQSPWLAHFSSEPTHSSTMSRSLKPAGYGILTLPKNTISKNWFKPVLSLWYAVLESHGPEPIMTHLR